MEREYELLGRMAEITGSLTVYERDDDGQLVPEVLHVEGEPVIRLDQAKAIRRVIFSVFGVRMEVKFKPHRARRSDRQNRYIWGVVVPCVRAWKYETEGVKYEKDEIYLWLRVGLLGHKPVITDVSGVQVITMSGKRFSQMNTKEFTDAIEDIRQRLALQDCVVPEPRQENFLSEFLNLNDQ